MYLIELSRTGKVIVEDDGVYAIPEFRELINTNGFGEPSIRAIALICDYNSPYRHRPEVDRPTFVLRDIYGKDSKKTLNINSEKCKAAIAKYNILQYDPYREELKATQNIIRISTKLKNGLNLTDIKQLQTAGTYISRIEKFELRLEKLKKIIKEDGSEGPVKEGTSLYRLEEKYKSELNN